MDVLILSLIQQEFALLLNRLLITRLMAIIKGSEEITVIIYKDGNGEVYFRNNIESPKVCSGETIVRWLMWLDVLERASKTPK